MRRKSLSYKSPRAQLLNVTTILAFCAASVVAEEIVATNRASMILGATTCSSSSCHGGGGANQNQYLVWSLKDFHSQRPFATLTTARSKQIADALNIKDPTADKRCTSCHAPLQEVPELFRGESFRVSEGVSCESCHGPAENWLRAHTRPDWTHADRTAAGMRDLKNLYVRANTCVACHQTVETPLLKAGHPELIFELDGQSVSQPRHWREKTNWNGAQTWLVGQAVALREMSWQLSRETVPDEKLVARWSALLWLLKKLDGISPEYPTLNKLQEEPVSQNFIAAQKAGDELAQRASTVQWTDAMSLKALETLASVGGDFRQKDVLPHSHACRAEWLVLAMDRLFASCKDAHSAKSIDADIARLFKQAQSRPDFNASEFADTLNQLSQSLKD